MARWKTPRAGRRKQEPGRGPLIGCVLLILLLIGFVTWAFFALLTPK